MIKEFKEFAASGNMLDMAVGIIIGAAFATVIGSLVADIIMPPVGMAMGGVDFNNLHAVIQDAPSGPASYATVEAATEAGAVTINYGRFINNLITFLIVALVLFLIIRGVNKTKKAAEEAPEEPAAQEVLLGEIRDLLRTRG